MQKQNLTDKLPTTQREFGHIVYSGSLYHFAILAVGCATMCMVDEVKYANYLLRFHGAVEQTDHSARVWPHGVFRLIISFSPSSWSVRRSIEQSIDQNAHRFHLCPDTYRFHVLSSLLVLHALRLVRYCHAAADKKARAS